MRIDSENTYGNIRSVAAPKSDNLVGVQARADHLGDFDPKTDIGAVKNEDIPSQLAAPNCSQQIH